MNIGNTLKIDKNKRFLVEKKDILGPFVKAIKKYSVNRSIPKIKQKINIMFSKCHVWKILNAINDLDTSDGISFKRREMNVVIHRVNMGKYKDILCILKHGSIDTDLR